MKVLAGRAQDLADLESLLQVASDHDLEVARRSVALISRRGANLGKDLEAELGELNHAHRRWYDPNRRTWRLDMRENPKPVAWTLLGTGLLAGLGAVWLLARGSEISGVLIPGLFMIVFGVLLLVRSEEGS